MRQMKNSKIEWIGKIPDSWKICRLKYLAKKIERGTSPNYTDIPMTKVVNQATFSKGFFDKRNIRFSDIPAKRSKGLLYNSDILLASTGGGVLGKVHYFNERDTYVADSHVTITRTIPEEYCSRMLYYIFYINYDYFNALMARGSTNQIELQTDLLKSMEIPVPPLSEQKVIAGFLDKKCGEVDALIADIQQEIETLEQYKRSVITEAVTRGLDPSVPMKESGIDWLGEIPMLWETKRIAAFYQLRNEKVSDKDFPPLSVTKQGVLPQLETVAKTDDGDNRKLVRKGDFAINSRSDRRGSCGISDYDGSVSLINIVLKPRDKANNKYYNWLFHTEQFADEFYKWGNGIVDDLWTTRWQNMKKIIIPVPPIENQQKIADYLDKKCKEIEEIIAEKQSQIETLESYKKSLIYEYVTGKKEVIA